MFKNGIDENEIIARLRDEFLDDARLRLELIRKARDAAQAKDCENDPFQIFRAEVHTLKGTGQSFGFPSLTLISRRLEGYVRPFDGESFAADTGVDRFIAAIADVINAGEEPDDDALDALLDSLPGPAPED